MIFNGDYMELYKKEAKAQLEKQAGKDLNKDVDTVIAANGEHFIMTDKGFKFFFDSGTVAPAEKGVLTVEIPYSTMKPAMREDIGSRVIDPTKPMVAITYDDGPDPKTTPQILDLYEKEQVVCTFFEVGQNVDNIKESPDLLKRMLSLGCEIGSHTYSHPNLYKLSPEKVKEEGDKTTAAIEKACGKKPTIFRPAYGNGNDAIAEAFDLPSINWSVDTLDWKTKDKDKIIASVKSVGNLDGQIILMHSIYQPSVDASKELVPWLKEQGYQLVTVTELLQYKYNETPQKGKDYGYNFYKLGKQQ